MSDTTSDLPIQCGTCNSFSLASYYAVDGSVRLECQECRRVFPVEEAKKVQKRTAWVLAQ
ncbi:MAG: hypothetical protein ACLQEQ_05665 [Nitrososphaerales archaeon]